MLRAQGIKHPLLILCRLHPWLQLTGCVFRTIQSLQA